MDQRPRSERDILDAIRRMMRALRLAANATQSSLGISAAQVYVLQHLSGRDVVSISELAEMTLTDRTSVAAVVERLVEQGLASRSPSRSDRRRAQVQITDAGARLVSGSARPPTDLLVSALRALPDDEITDLARSLSSLVAAMGLESTPAEMLFEDRATKPTG